MVQARARVRIRYSIGRDYCLDKRTEQWLNGGVVCASIRGVLLGGGNNPQRTPHLNSEPRPAVFGPIPVTASLIRVPNNSKLIVIVIVAFSSSLLGSPSVQHSAQHVK